MEVGLRLCSNELSNESLDLVVDREGEGHVQDHTSQTRSNTLVETWDTLSLENVLEGTEEAALMGIQTLQVSLNHINRVVEHDGAETSETTWKKIDKNLPSNVLLQDSLRHLEDNESNTLVGWLLEEGGNDTLVDTAEALVADNGSDTVEHITILGVLRELIVDELGLDGLLGCND